MEMNRKWRLAGAALAVLLVSACTTADGPTGTPVYPDVSSFAKNVPANGPGACLLEDTQDAGFLSNVKSLNCTSNDVDIAFAKVSEYRINGVGGFLELGEGEKIECTPGDKIELKTTAFFQNNAQARYDFGFWLNPNHGGSAVTGASCLHYNLVPGQGGSTTQETGGNGGTVDQCGDMGAGVLASIDLGTLDLVCPGGGATTIDIEGCAAWSNGTTGSNDRVCPIGGNETRDGYAWGTTPGTTAKCRCEPMNLPVLVKGGVELKKVWVGTAPPQPLTGSTTLRIGTTAGGSEVDSEVSNAPNPSTTGSHAVNPGTYFFSENPDPPTGYTSSLSCEKNGNPVVPGSNGSVALVGGDIVVCTFTNTRQTGTIELKKVWGGNQATTTTLKIGSTGAGSSNIKNVAGGPANFTTGAGHVVNTGTYHLTEDLTNLAGYATSIACTRNNIAFVPTTVNAGLQQFSVVVNAGDAVICTFTNTLNLFQEWCSPGYWRNAKWDFWTFLGISSGQLYSTVPNVNDMKPALKNGISDATLLQILNAPQTYGGPAFNYVGSYLSGLHPDIDFTLGDEVQEDAECPINAFGNVSNGS